MTTQVFKSYSEFLDREDQKINGVSESFAQRHPNYQKQNETNEGCWNCSRCSGCSDCSGCSHCSGCSGLTNNAPSQLLNIPVIENIHTRVLDAVSNPGALNMSEWHADEKTNEDGAYCGTTHCRAGWVVTLAGKAGRDLEQQTSTLFAAMQIYHKSSPIGVSPTRFFESNEKAMEDMKRCAEQEANA